MDLDYKAMLRIDPERLPAEWLKQPTRYMEFVEARVDADARLDQMKDRLDVVSAMRGRKIRDRLETNKERVTERTISDELILDPEYRKAKTAVNEAWEDAAIIRGAVDAMEHRKRALENLTQVELAQVRSELRLPGQGVSGSRETISKHHMKRFPVQGRRS